MITDLECQEWSRIRLRSMTKGVPCPECAKPRSKKGNIRSWSGPCLISCGLTARACTIVGCCSNQEHRSFNPVAELLTERMAFIDGCQRDWDTLPPPGHRLPWDRTVALSTSRCGRRCSMTNSGRPSFAGYTEM
jgi:hypothetical protein